MFSAQAYRKEIAPLASYFVFLFWKSSFRHAFFHLFFITLISAQLIGLGLFFQTLIHSVIIVFWLGMLFTSVFGYLLLFFYQQSRRQEKLNALCHRYLTEAKQAIPFPAGSLEYHGCMTDAIVAFTSMLKIEPMKHRWITFSQTFTYLIEKWKIWTSWRDLLRIKEMLFFSSIQEHIRLIKRNPADLEAHATLAMNYIALAALYRDPKKLMLSETLSWIPPEYRSQEMHEKFQEALERALEEYQIIDAYAPDDLWVHAQKAALYRELGDQELEQQEYEKMLQRDGSNIEILYRLGVLYFQKGENAKGLKIYHLLQSLDEEKSKKLIHAYDSYALEQYIFEKEEV